MQCTCDPLVPHPIMHPRAKIRAAPNPHSDNLISIEGSTLMPLVFRLIFVDSVIDASHFVRCESQS